MRFCLNCGKEVFDGDRFCSDCGNAVGGSNTSKSQKRTINYGQVHKCPNCGEVIDSFGYRCPSCGYEIRGAKVSASVEQFTSALARATSNDQRILIIRSYPIPNTKEDIFEFMILASTNISGVLDESVFDAWVTKYNQSYQKGLLVISDSIDFSRIQMMYEETQKRIKLEKKKIKKIQNKKNKIQRKEIAADKAAQKDVQRTRVKVMRMGIAEQRARRRNERRTERRTRRPHFMINLDLDFDADQLWDLLSTIIRLSAKNAAVIAAVIMYFVAVTVDRKGENGAGWELFAALLLIASDCLLFRRKADYIEYVISAIGSVIIYNLNKSLDNGSFAILTGGLSLIIIGINFLRKAAHHNED